ISVVMPIAIAVGLGVAVAVSVRARRLQIAAATVQHIAVAAAVAVAVIVAIAARRRVLVVFEVPGGWIRVDPADRGDQFFLRHLQRALGERFGALAGGVRQQRRYARVVEPAE